MPRADNAGGSVAMQTRDQKYAITAYKHVSKVSEDDKQSYGAMAHKLPILIRTAGLAQALAFVDTRGKKPQTQLLTDIALTIGQADNQTLLKRACQAELSEYIHLTKQVMDALLWYKRFAQSILGIDASDTNDENEVQ